METNFQYNVHCVLRFVFVFLHCLLCLDIMKPCLSAENGSFKCFENERHALLGFKGGLNDPSRRLSSWVGEDCCKWEGIGCDNSTGRITKIDLRNPFRMRDSDFDETLDSKFCLAGKINSSLLQLKHLKFLDLSLNCFDRIEIPKFFGMFKDLKYLNLASSSFAGEIPTQIGNLSNLQYLDLYGNFDLSSESLHWVRSLSSLTHLNLGRVNLRNTQKDWLQSINQLPSLLELHLYFCGMIDSDLHLPFVNFSSLVALNMSGNSFGTSFPHWLLNLTDLEILDLGYNALTGPIPGQFGTSCNLKSLELSGNLFDLELKDFLYHFSGCANPRLERLGLKDSQLVGELPDSLGLLKNLRSLDLSGNLFWGSLPASIGNLLSLRTLDVSENQMNGTIPESLGKLSELVELNLESNKWNGTLTEAHFVDLTRLESIKLTIDPAMTLVFSVPYDWVPPFKLKYIHIENCLVGPMFATWLQSQSFLNYVVLSNTGIDDVIPKEWFLRIASEIAYLDLSNNQIKGELPDRLVSPNLIDIDLSSNHFEGLIPLWSADARHIYLYDNMFSGHVPENFGELMSNLIDIDFSDNFLNGSVPSSICEIMDLTLLSLRNNRISGQLPDCWENLARLEILDVSNNSISGELPVFMGNLRLLALLISNNNFLGEISNFLQNLGPLILDLSGNNFSGEIPLWIGEREFLLILLLGSNSLTGEIPEELCRLRHLHFLDLSNNNLSGTIPRCFSNLSALANHDTFFDKPRIYESLNKTFSFKEGIYDLVDEYDIFSMYPNGHVVIRTKGKELEYGRILGFVNGIDLSGNTLSGSIPDEISSLSQLGILNLSRNHLNGTIPKNIGKLTLLETLDLSWNNISGPVPQSLTNLTFLSHLNLSYNNLEDRIPSGRQLQTLNDSSMYEGNPLLCGDPLPRRCPGDETIGSPESGAVDSKSDERDRDDDDDGEKLGFYISVVIGFLVGLWGVYVTLMVKSSWRYAYFGFLDETWGRIVVFASKLARHGSHRG